MFCFCDSFKAIKSKEERRLKAKQQKLAFIANQTAKSENPPQAEDSAGHSGKGWFLYKTVDFDDDKWQICTILPFVCFDSLIDESGVITPHSSY